MICGKNITFRELWLKEQFKKLRESEIGDKFTNQELKEFLLNKYNSRRVSEGRFFNNSTSDNEIMTQEQFINKYLNEPLILSGYACLYKNQNDSVNISSKALENLGEMRKFNKKKMEAAEHGSDDYVFYRILQLTYKVLMNSYYGILGEKNSVFFNPYVQNSITMTGQDLITTAIEGMEAFLSNNVEFESTDDCLTFIHNVITKKNEFNILDYVDDAISKSELIDYLVSHTTESGSVDAEIIRPTIDKLDSEQITRLYYTNQVMKLVENNWFLNKFNNLKNFVYADAPAEEMKEDLEMLKSRIIDFCYYPYLFEERFKKATKYKRKTVITIDTDLTYWVR